MPPHLAFLKSLFPGCCLLCNCREGSFVLLPEVTSLQTPLSRESPPTAPWSTVSSCPFLMLCSPEAFPLEGLCKDPLGVPDYKNLFTPPSASPLLTTLGLGSLAFPFRLPGMPCRHLLDFHLSNICHTIWPMQEVKCY